jgi:hypothetical protein
MMSLVGEGLGVRGIQKWDAPWALGIGSCCESSLCAMPHAPCPMRHIIYVPRSQVKRGTRLCLHRRQARRLSCLLESKWGVKNFWL